MSRPTGEKHHNWKGGIRKHSGGYLLQKVNGHPNGDRFGYVYQHRLVVEQSIGRYLKRGESVHHVNGDKTDNRIENLMLFSSESEHHLFELKNKGIMKHCKKCGVEIRVPFANHDYCENCKNTVCLWCGVTFLNPRSVGEKRGRKYCGVQCRNEANLKRFKENNPNRRSYTKIPKGI